MEPVVDAEGFAARLDRYVEWMQVNHFSEKTAQMRRRYLGEFVGWCAERGLTRPTEIVKPMLERYQKHLFHRRKKDGTPLSVTSQRIHVATLRAFFRWLARQNLVLFNPASEIIAPRKTPRLPKRVLSVAEVEGVLARPDVETLLGVRDRAILETLYSTGMRRKEIVGLGLYDLDVERGTVMVREGKGGRQRLIPIGERAAAWVEKYLHEVRPHFSVEPDPGSLFVTHHGAPFTPESMAQLVRKYLTEVGIVKQGAVHLFRHSMATLMLEAGADIRFIQAMLGHAKLETTTVYTQVAIKKLKEVHAMTHPAKMKRGEEPVEKSPGRFQYRRKDRAGAE